jgi:hypothetical protein
VAAIALTVKAVIDSIKTAAVDWPTGTMNMDKTRLELEMMRKKASQEIVASSGTGQKPPYKEHAVTGFTNSAKLQAHLTEQGFREIKTLIERRNRKSSR